jgi:hypothetical protein
MASRPWSLIGTLLAFDLKLGLIEANESSLEIGA